MNIQLLSRQEKENLYIHKMTELQRRWENPISPNDFDDLYQYTDEQLNKSLEDTLGQLQFERWLSWISRFFGFLIKTFVILGVVGLLSFGFRQLFW